MLINDIGIQGYEVGSPAMAVDGVCQEDSA